jgi:hypothetical protein
MDGNELTRERFADVEPVSPSGEGGPLTFSATFTAALGEHEFTLVLDVNNNLTESRKDNNNQSVTLTIVDPYVARIDPPLDPIRIAPGNTETIQIALTATGSRTADWTLSIDDSALPSAWSFTPNTGANLNPNLAPNAGIIVDFSIAVPSTALGDENSYVDLLLTLDDDEAVISTLRLPIEVLRTRGLSVVGPAGLSESDGIGRPNHDAKAWLVVENLGNAQESTTSIDWTAPSWGGTPALYTADGTEVFSLTLAPNEDVELFATLGVPASTTLGTSTSSMLTVCIGSGEDTLCQDMDVNFHASELAASPSHIRTLPDSTLEWSLEATLPSDGHLEWNMAEAQMIQTGWVWSATGDASVNGTTLEMIGTPGGAASAVLQLVLPVNAVPQRHAFATAESSELHYELNITLHVLQVFRSAATVLDPTPLIPNEPVDFKVGETQSVLLRLENPGNGEDTFILTGAIVADPNITPQPDVEFTIYNPERTLGPLATTIATVDVVLDEDTPALNPFQLQFMWTSQGEGNIAAVTALTVQAEPDYRWEINDIDVETTEVAPGDEVSIEFTVKNIGNTPDTLTINPSFEVTHAGNDTSTWSAASNSSEQIDVNGTQSMSIGFTVPYDAWFMTDAMLLMSLYSGNVYVSNETLEFSVVHASAWRFNLSDTSLTIAPGGENLTLKVDQLGNHPEAPWFTKAGQGWPIELPENGETVNPGESTTMTVFVTPPEDALAGEVGVLRIRISDANGAGQIVQEIPVRVGQEANISVEHRGTWKVNEDGGMPTAWLENNGNDVAVVQISVDGLPTGWLLNGSDQVVIAPGQLLGLPLMLTPDEAWNKQRILVTLKINHPSLGEIAHGLEVEYGTHTFHTTPVHLAREGTLITIQFGQTVDSGLTSSDSVDFGERSISFMMGDEENELLLESSTDSSNRMSIFTSGYTLPSVDVDCELNEQAFNTLGRIALTGSVGECRVTASDQVPVKATILVISDQGDTVPLRSSGVSLGSGENGTYDLNVTSWTPEAAQMSITVLVVDSYGRILDEETVEVVSRASGWNVGIFSFTADEELKVSIQRTSYDVLEDVNCHVEVNTVDNSLDEPLVRVIDIAEGDFPPVVIIPAPSELADNKQLKATLTCDAPYDLDDDPNDNEATALYIKAQQPIVESSEIVISLVVASLLLVVAYLTGMMGTKQKASSKPKPKPLPTGTTQAKAEPSPVEEVEEEEDEFSFELTEEPVSESIVTEESQQVDTVEIIDLPDEEDVTPSGRLASMRDEMTDNQPSAEGREDRMRRFFGNQ